MKYSLLVVGLLLAAPHAYAESLYELQDEMRHQYNMLQMDIEDMRNELEHERAMREINRGYQLDQRLYDEHMSMPRWMRCQTDFTAC